MSDHTHEWMDVTPASEELTCRRYVCSGCSATKTEWLRCNVDRPHAADECEPEIIADVSLADVAKAAGDIMRDHPEICVTLERKDLKRVAEEMLAEHDEISTAIVRGAPIVASGFFGPEPEPLPRPPAWRVWLEFFRTLPDMLGELLEDARYNEAHAERHRQRAREERDDE